MNYSQVLSDIEDVEGEAYPFDKQNLAHKSVERVLSMVGKEWDQIPREIMAEIVGYIGGVIDNAKFVGYNNGVNDVSQY